MRRVKSSPSNLAKMSHNKRYTKNNIYMSSKSIPIIIKPENNFKLIKSLKKDIKTVGNLASDALVEINYNNYSLEEMTIFSAIINYFSNNVLKKNKFKEIYYFITKTVIRYIIMLFIHTQILHDKIDNHLINILLLPPTS